MVNNLLDFSKYENSNSKFKAELSQRGGNINFSNSGKGGNKKYFTLSLDSFLTVFKDIKTNIFEFQGHENYAEKKWRDLGSLYYTDKPANAQSTVQTKPMFVTLSKIIMWANSYDLEDVNPEQKIELDASKIETTIIKLNQLADKFSPSNKSANEVSKSVNIKVEFAEWLYRKKKYERVYKGDKSILIEKLNEYEIAYENDFGISIFDFPNLSLEDIKHELKTNVIDEAGEIGSLNKKTVGNGSVKAILGPINYIRFIDTLINKNKTVLFESDSLRLFAIEIFKLTFTKFNEEFLKNNLTKNSKKSTIGNTQYTAVKFPKYFSSTSMLAIFDKEQDKQTLTTGKSQRYSEKNLKILNSNFIYFNYQWSHPKDSSSANFYELKAFIKDWSNSIYNLEFIENKKNKVYQLIESNKNQIKLNLNKFEKDTNSSGLTYSNKLITRYISSLVTKPFVLLSGLSGSGKTKLAQSFAQWLCEDKTQYCIVPVGADWTNREPLLGYVNALNNSEYILPENGALQLLLRANNNQEKPYFLILDEMNLSHVERYFADFLSVMESKDKFKLHSDKESEKSGVPHEINWPKNLFVVGTVNIDETTYMFSPKVLDRANVIEFRINETEMGTYLSEATEVTDLNGEGKNMGESFITIATQKTKTNSKNLTTTLNDFFITLQKVGAEFGYRTASEIQTLFGQIDLVNPSFLEKENEKIDIAVMQKLLPKLHGSRSKLTPVLKTLATLCYQNNKGFTAEQKDKIFEKVKDDNKKVQYPISLEKITRMYHNVIANGFTSYAEA